MHARTASEMGGPTWNQAFDRALDCRLDTRSPEDLEQSLVCRRHSLADLSTVLHVNIQRGHAELVAPFGVQLANLNEPMRVCQLSAESVVGCGDW